MALLIRDSEYANKLLFQKKKKEKKKEQESPKI